jgi:hypothetical protein
MTRSIFGGPPREYVRRVSVGWFLLPALRRLWKKASRKLAECEYLVVPGPDLDVAVVDGALEQRIVKVVRGWADQPAARDLPFAPTVFDLVQAIVPFSVEPGDWVVRMVQEDAIARELGTMRRRALVAKRKFIPNPVYIGRLREEGQAVLALREELAGAQPGFVRHMVAGIERAISSRMSDSSV